MITVSQDTVISSFRSFSRGAGLGAAIIGIISSLIWMSGLEALRGMISVFGIVQIDTSAAFFLSGAALFFLNKDKFSPVHKKVSVFCALCVLLISVFFIAGYIRGTETVFLQNIVFRSGTGPAEALRMAPTTTLYFAVLSLALLFLSSGRFIFSGQVLALAGILLGLINLMGHTYEVPALLAIGNYPQTDLLSTILFTFLMLGGLLSCPDRHIVSIISSGYIGGVIARKLLPIAVSIPFLLGWLRLIGQKSGLYELETGVTITGIFSIAVFAIVVWWFSGSLNRVDAERKKAADEAEATNRKLAGLVRDLEEETRKENLISEMKDLLQSCSTVNETAPVIKKFIEQLVPSCRGALFLFSPSRNDLELFVGWGGFGTNEEEQVFYPEECWALRRGRPYLVRNIASDIICSHVKEKPVLPYCCMPFTAYGDVLGLLHLREGAVKPADIAAASPAEEADMQKTATMIAEHLAVPLANLRLKETLKNQSIRDPLTGLFNRRYMEETLQREVFRAKRVKGLIGIMMIDIDHFKKINDVFGHSAGDELLISLSRLLQSSIRASDVACRYGGEEFTLFLPEASSDGIFKRAEDLRNCVKALKVTHRGQLLESITISVGISVYPEHGETPDDLLRVADSALYRAKKEGRDRTIVG